MSDYVDVPLPTEPDDIEQIIYEDLQARVPGWQPSNGGLLTIVIQVIAMRIAVVMEQLSRTLRSVFRVYGATLAGIPQEDATFAQIASTWTMRDNAGYTIQPGWTVGLRAAGDELVAFQVLSEVVVPPGSTVTAAGGVELIAVEAGALGTGLGGTVELIDDLDVVAGVAVVGTSVGGRDAESDEDYLDRLVRELRRFGPRVITAQDFADAAQETAGDGYRALALDGYDPGAGTYGHDKMVTVALVDPTGEPASGGVKTAVDAALQAQRETNFDLRVIDATYTDVDVTFTAKSLPGYTPSAVEEAAEAAVTAYLSPATWGTREADDQAWHQTSVVRYGELYAVLNGVDGLDYVTALSIEGAADTNFTLTGAAPMPRPGTVAGTVSAP